MRLVPPGPGHELLERVVVAHQVADVVGDRAVHEAEHQQARRPRHQGAALEAHGQAERTAQAGRGRRRPGRGRPPGRRPGRDGRSARRPRCTRTIGGGGGHQQAATTARRRRAGPSATSRWATTTRGGRRRCRRRRAARRPAPSTAPARPDATRLFSLTWAVTRATPLNTRPTATNESAEHHRTGTASPWPSRPRVTATPMTTFMPATTMRAAAVCASRPTTVARSSSMRPLSSSAAGVAPDHQQAHQADQHQADRAGLEGDLATDRVEALDRAVEGDGGRVLGRRPPRPGPGRPGWDRAP